jgi:hypothetical protein
MHVLHPQCMLPELIYTMYDDSLALFGNLTITLFACKSTFQKICYSKFSCVNVIGPLFYFLCES